MIAFGLEEGAYYAGEQTTSNGSFKIDMKVNKFSLSQSFLCGTFKIYNLTSQYSILKTYFEGEMIGTNYPFDQREDDLYHWERFPTWNRSFVDMPHTYNPYCDKHLYLRIKELFLLPDPTVDKISGASIDGFYYCCYFKNTDSFGGFYQVAGPCRHGTQQLVLVRVPEKYSQSADFI